MAVDKKVKYDMQGGVRNYLGKQKQVKAPLKWQSSPDHPTTELAYITQAEKNLLVKQDLHGSLNGGVNRGPSGIMSLDGYGSFDDPSDTGKDTGMSGAATSDAESGKNTSNTMAEGASYKDVQDYQAASVAAGAGQRVNPGFFDSRNTVSPDVLARAKAFAPQAYKANRSSGIMDYITGGGLIGSGIRGLGRMFGLGKTYNEPTYDMSGYNSLGLSGTGQEGYGVPNFESGDGDYDMLGNKINEITGEITSPEGQSLGFAPGYPGGPNSSDGGITTLPTSSGRSDDYVNLIDQYVPDDPVIPNDAFKSRFLQNRTTEEREAIEAAMTEKFKDFGGFGLGDMDGS